MPAFSLLSVSSGVTLYRAKPRLNSFSSYLMTDGKVEVSGVILLSTLSPVRIFCSWNLTLAMRFGHSSSQGDFMEDTPPYGNDLFFSSFRCLSLSLSVIQLGGGFFRNNNGSFLPPPRVSIFPPVGRISSPQDFPMRSPSSSNTFVSLTSL